MANSSMTLGTIDLSASLPITVRKIRSSIFRPIWKQWVWLLVADFFLLMYCGAMPAEGIWVTLSRIGTAYWFLFFIVIAPVTGWLEKPRFVPDSVHHYMQIKNNKVPDEDKSK